MSKEGQLSSAIPSASSDLEFARLQLGQAITTYQTQLSLLVQIITILVIADATVVGYAISTQIAGILLIGPLFPIMIFVVSRIIFKLSLPTVYTAVSIEQKYGNTNGDWLASTFVSTTISPDYLNRLKTIASTQDSSERIKQLRSAPAPSFKGPGTGITKLALVLIMLGQIIAPFILSSYFGWRMF
jgi:hypothetical protein